ncbi:MAG: FAD:protein FMN transferase [Crocinitomicaceae bacterium]|nr:FAD:protein FMN transferase [Crocinitomicaceae bacterium]
MHFLRKAPFPLLLIILISGFSCVRKKTQQPLPGRAYQGVFFNVPYSIDVVGDSTNYQYAIDSITGIAAYHFDLNNPNSTISRYNRFDRTDVAFRFRDSLNFFGIVYSIAQDLNTKSGQLYDPTTMPLKMAWLPIRMRGLGGEPNLDSLYRFVGFDGAKVDITEPGDMRDSGLSETLLRKSDPRISLDFTDLATAYSLDQIGQFLESKEVTQFKIQCGNKTITSGAFVRDLNIINLGVTQDSADQKILMINRSFAYKTLADKQGMVDPTYGYPVDNEFLYVGVSAKSLVESVAWAEIFMIMGLEQAQAWYDQNENSDIQSFIVIKNEDGITTASTEGFDTMLLLPDSMEENE